MKISYFLQFILICLLWLSCAEAENVTLLSEKMELEGTFQRISGDEAGPVAEVTILLRSGKWEGNSSRSKYPALCKGSYLVSENTISFENECMWTADFDWTLILNGTYTILQTKTHMIWEKKTGDNNQFLDRYTFLIEDREKLVQSK
ncbi:MAG: hypothetical protein EA341_06615 [Mongoliibacter sp.]|uniref:hypothetical protein n=1 Tax=Mongoliibacter sp. TaxID=2022438 RepID=UPI0012F35756|nr:hypothetical protein [Mongoliibacter sp.]TVP50846.1 MAG: hypothetical protein EA341_06615 [Mongoliibacter sp.]